MKPGGVENQGVCRVSVMSQKTPGQRLMGAGQVSARVKGAAGPWSSVTPVRATMVQVSKGGEGGIKRFPGCNDCLSIQMDSTP